MRVLGCARPTRARGAGACQRDKLIERLVASPRGGATPHGDCREMGARRGMAMQKVGAVAAERAPVAFGCAGVWCHDQTRAVLVAARLPLQGGGRRRPQTATNHPQTANPVPIGECVPAYGLKLTTPFGLRVTQRICREHGVLFSTPQTGADRSTSAAPHGVNSPTGWRGPNEGESLNDWVFARPPGTPRLARRLPFGQHHRTNG